MEPIYLFHTTKGVTIMATLRGFLANWHQYILDRGEAYTWELYKEVI